MAVNGFDIDRVVRLAKLELTPEEKVKFSRQLSEVLEYMKKLNEVDTTGVEPLRHIFDNPTPLRADKAEPSLQKDYALLNAPSQEGGFFTTPKIKD